MSAPAKVTLFLACGITVGIVGYVHYKQQLDRERLHDGVLRDIEVQQRRKIENLYVLERQKEITKKYKEAENS